MDLDMLVLVAWIFGGVAFIVSRFVGPETFRPNWALPHEADPYLHAASAAGLEGIAVHDGQVEGRAGAHLVRLQGLYGVNPASRVAVDGVAPGLSLRSEDHTTRLRTSLGFREVQTGDDAFDDGLFVEGPVEVVHALFDEHARRLTRLAFQGRSPQGDGWSSARSLPVIVSLEKGSLVARITHGARARREQELTSCVRALLALARCLEVPDDCALRLASNLRQDPLPAVRLANLRALAREFPHHPSTVEALTAAAADGDPRVRLEAAVALGPQGRPVVLELASDPSTDPELAARALDALGADLPAEKGCAILEDALRARRSVTARAALEALGRVGGDVALAALSKVLVEERGEIALAAARALGRAGTVAAIPVLRDVWDDPAQDRALRHAARAAVASIQARLPGASRGRLALADDAGGRLSVPADGGWLSLPSEEPEAARDARAPTKRAPG